MWATMRARSSADSGDQRTCILRAEYLLHSRAHFLVGKELASIQLFEALQNWQAVFG
jgi:hypothetical protein